MSDSERGAPRRAWWLRRSMTRSRDRLPAGKETRCGTIQAMHRDRQSTGELLAAGQEALGAASVRTGELDSVAAILDQARGEAEAAHDLKAEAAAIDQQGLLTHYRAIERPVE